MAKKRPVKKSPVKKAEPKPVAAPECEPFSRGPANHPPICVAIPSTIESKMRAIVALAEAQRDLARAINSANVMVDISNCHFSTSDVGIKVDVQE